jgi:hypothetical protein
MAPLHLGPLLYPKEGAEAHSRVRLPQKTVKHSPAQKLIDALMGILAGGRASPPEKDETCGRPSPIG